jgi:hypothetical protein
LNFTFGNIPPNLDLYENKFDKAIYRKRIRITTITAKALIKAWPETEEERRGLLDGSEQSYPNEMGHKLWADYLVDYFINE